MKMRQFVLFFLALSFFGCFEQTQKKNSSGKAITAVSIETEPKAQGETNQIEKSSSRKAVSTGWDGKIIVTKEDGSIVLELPYSVLRKINQNAVDGAILGWSTDKRYVWFESNYDASIVLYGRIDVEKASWETFKPPRNFLSRQIEIDFNNGNIVYSDFPYQVDTQTSEETRKSKKEFRLYKGNLINQTEVMVDKNYGEGFELKKDPNGRFFYRKSSNEEFALIAFES